MTDLVERLCAYVAELEKDRDAWMLLAKAKPLPMDGCPAYCDTGRNLSARVAELEKDAARYRWLREESKKNPDFYSNEPRWMVSRAQGGRGNNFFGEGIDAAIDAAMKEGEG